MHLALVFVAILTPIVLHLSPVDAVSPDLSNPLLVQTSSGPVRGVLDTNTTSAALQKWLGVPFAADTSGLNRWRPPKPVFNPEVFDASDFGPACLQGR